MSGPYVIGGPRRTVRVWQRLYGQQRRKKTAQTQGWKTSIAEALFIISYFK